MNRSYVQPRFRCTGQGFIVLAQPATTSQPRQCSLNHPPAWQHLKLMAGPGTLDDLQDPARHGHHPVHQLAAVASVSPDESQAWESSYQFIDDQPRPISVLDIGRMHHHRQQQAHGIYDDVSLSTATGRSKSVPLGLRCSAKMSACDESRQEPLVAARSVESRRQGNRWLSAW